MVLRYSLYWLMMLLVLMSICFLNLLPSSTEAGDAYRGRQHWHRNMTRAVKTLASTPFARCQVHTVQTGPHSQVNDWLWFDEREHVNILVRLGEDFVVFEQNKYGLHGVSLAPVGGFIDDGETAQDAAARELREEMGLQSADWVSLGSWVTSANRGGGRVHAFFADRCESHPLGKRPGFDLEEQREIRLSSRELFEALQANRFQEVKWAATVATALLLLSTHRDANTELDNKPDVVGAGGSVAEIVGAGGSVADGKRRRWLPRMHGSNDRVSSRA